MGTKSWKIEGGGNSFEIFVAINVATQHNILEDWGPSTPYTPSSFFYVHGSLHHKTVL
jgi:hypothetical protein